MNSVIIKKLDVRGDNMLLKINGFSLSADCVAEENPVTTMIRFTYSEMVEIVGLQVHDHGISMTLNNKEHKFPVALGDTIIDAMQDAFWNLSEALVANLEEIPTELRVV